MVNRQGCVTYMVIIWMLFIPTGYEVSLRCFQPDNLHTDKY